MYIFLWSFPCLVFSPFDKVPITPLPLPLFLFFPDHTEEVQEVLAVIGVGWLTFTALSAPGTELKAINLIQFAILMWFLEAL